MGPGGVDSRVGHARVRLTQRAVDPCARGRIRARPPNCPNAPLIATRSAAHLPAFRKFRTIFACRSLSFFLCVGDGLADFLVLDTWRGAVNLALPLSLLLRVDG